MPRSTLRQLFVRAGCVLLLGTACNPELDTTRTPPPRNTLGEEFFGVLCDRMGTQSLPEDLSGASFQRICHRGAEGTFSERVALEYLPSPEDGAVDASGNPVPLERQQAARTEAVLRLEVLGRHRAELVAALDAVFPESEVAIKDLGNTDPALTCGPANPGTARLAKQLGELLGRMSALYLDDTLPAATRGLGGWLSTFSGSAEATQAWAMLAAREGYQPPERGLGLVRSVVGWQGTRDLLDVTTRELSPSATPGPTRLAFEPLVEVLHHELRTAEPPAELAPLRATRDELTGREVLSRPRTATEFLSSLLLTETAGSSTSTEPPALLVRRDARGLALVPSVMAPFVDADGDGLADVDAQGRFVSASADQPVPTPFPVAGVADSAPRDAQGRALTAEGGSPLYAYLDARRTLLGSVTDNLPPLLATTPEQPQSMAMELLSSLPPLLGSRDGSKKTARDYPPATVTYDAFHPEDAAALELVHAGAEVLGQPASDDVLALARTLVTDNTNDVARLVGTGLALRRISKAHPEAELAPGTTFRDDMLDVLVKISREPGLLEDLLRALANPDTLGLAPAFASYMQNGDRIGYDRAKLNGPPRNLTSNDITDPHTPVDRTQPDVGNNRSLMQRFLNVVHDSNHTAFCNKAGAVVHAVTSTGNVDMPLFGGTYKECEVFKIDNMAVFYVQSIVGKASLYLRPTELRNGIAGFGATTVKTMEDSSGITGFWDAATSQTLRPKPQWVGRSLVFDQANDSPTSGGTNYKTNHFLTDLLGPNIGSAVCPERIIADPVPTAPDASPDGKVHGLRSCSATEWLPKRGSQDTLLMLETQGFLKALTPVLLPFTNRNREDLFIELMEVLHRHWADERTVDSECLLTRDPADPRPVCSKAGAVRFELMMAELLQGDTLGSLNALATKLNGMKVTHCDSVDETTHSCQPTSQRDAVTVLAEFVRTALDPARADAAGVADRRGNRTFTRTDGTTQPMTPLLLLLNALTSVDDAYASDAARHPGEPDKHEAFKDAISRITDQFLSVQGEREATTFVNPLLTQLAPPALDVLRAEMLARCPKTWTPPYERCAWIRDAWTQELADTMGGPAFATSVDFLDTVRQDAPMRTQVESLADHLLDASASQDAYASLLTLAADGVQFLAARDAQRTPLFHIAAEAAKPNDLVDSGLTLLRRSAGKAYGTNGAELCAQEMDPNELLTGVLTRLVTPVAIEGAQGAPRTPMDVFADAISAIQRVSPDQVGPRTAADYQRITKQMSEFFLDPEHGLERFYVVARKAGGTP